MFEQHEFTGIDSELVRLWLFSSTYHVSDAIRMLSVTTQWNGLDVYGEKWQQFFVFSAPVAMQISKLRNFPFISFEYIVVGLVFELVEFNGKPPILHSIKIEISRKKHGNVSVISLKNIAKCHGFDCCQYAMIDFDLSNIKIAILSYFFHQFSMNDSIAHLIRSLAFVSFLPFFTSFFSSIDIW